ncbi:MAG: hypothetical protein KDA84_21855 [Planctomycetaceae bacterium]|nr:hypothetical protein [Planctomycetaceae bacterium]
MRQFLAACLAMICGIGFVNAEEPADGLQLQAPAEWKGETISLPPSFSPNMTLNGTEVIRFAPGMFNQNSDSFFSYVFVFQVKPGQKLTQKLIQKELLVYYRGLAATVLKNQKIQFDPKNFALKLQETKAAVAVQPPNSKAYKGDLNWLEPFVTRKPQTLYLELTTWQDAESKYDYVFVCASPKKTTEAIWKDMRAIRESFYTSRQ